MRTAVSARSTSEAARSARGRWAAAITRLRRGGVVVYPTDTLWGLAARATDPAAVARLVALKGRDPSRPISIAVSSTEEIELWARLSPPVRAWVRTHLPGPYTVLLPPSAKARRQLPPEVLPAAGRLGLRVPDHPVARALAAAAGPITATSANVSGGSNVRDLVEARRIFGPSVGYVGGGPAPSGRPSAIVEWTGGALRERAR